MRTGKLDDDSVATLPQRTYHPEGAEGAEDALSLTEPEPEIPAAGTGALESPGRTVSGGAP